MKMIKNKFVYKMHEIYKDVNEDIDRLVYAIEIMHEKSKKLDDTNLQLFYSLVKEERKQLARLQKRFKINSKLLHNNYAKVFPYLIDKTIKNHSDVKEIILMSLRYIDFLTGDVRDLITAIERLDPKKGYIFTIEEVTTILTDAKYCVVEYKLTI